MEFRLTAADEQFRGEVRAFLKEQWSGDGGSFEASTADAFAAVSRVLGPETFAGGRTTVTPWPEPPELEPEAAPPSDAQVQVPEDTPAEAPADTPAQAPADTPAEAPAPTDVSAEIRAAEEVSAAEVTAVLTSVLDRLGAAHHRPFSRS